MISKTNKKNRSILNMPIKVAACTARQLFSKQQIIDSDGNKISGTLTIPDYQRPYKWDEKQIKKLVNDYCFFLSNEKITKNIPFYIGSIILHNDENNKTLNIIDGQQRLTTLGLIDYLQNTNQSIDLKFQSPESQKQILENIEYLKNLLSDNPPFDFNDINITLVVTKSRDDAYRFFETQNTGGVRLGGPDLIKAYHLRAIEKDYATEIQNDFAKKWESLGDLNPVVTSLLKGRYWKKLNLRTVPSHRQPQRVRNAIVREFAEKTESGEDIAFGRVMRIHKINGSQLEIKTRTGYELRQPLRSGCNTVNYLNDFETIRFKYLQSKTTHLTDFNTFLSEFLEKLEGCSYLKQLFDSCMIMYISKFGENKLSEAALKLFRVVYSTRISNQKAVKENSISAFVRNYPVLDWIDMCFTPKELFTSLDNFKLTLEQSNLDKNSIKKRFILSTTQYFDLNLEDKKLPDKFTTELDKKIIKYNKKS